MTDPIKELWVAEWKLFDPSNPPPEGDYCCEVPALVCSDGTIPVRLLHWYDGVWGGAYGAYQVRRYTPAPVPPEWVP